MGLYWVFYAIGGVIWNDVGAHWFGLAFGKHKLIKLSPKKTVEGFIGGALFSYLWILFISNFFASKMSFACP